MCILRCEWLPVADQPWPCVYYNCLLALWENICILQINKYMLISRLIAFVCTMDAIYVRQLCFISWASPTAGCSAGTEVIFQFSKKQKFTFGITQPKIWNDMTLAYRLETTYCWHTTPAPCARAYYYYCDCDSARFTILCIRSASPCYYYYCHTICLCLWQTF